jgi:hypothetical protein
LRTNGKISSSSSAAAYAPLPEGVAIKDFETLIHIYIYSISFMDMRAQG